MKATEVKTARKCHNNEAQPSRGTKRNRDEERTNNDKPNATYETIHAQTAKNCNLVTFELSAEKLLGMGSEGLKPVLIARNLTLNSDLVPNYKDFSTSSVKHHCETPIITKTVMKQSNGLK